MPLRKYAKRRPASKPTVRRAKKIVTKLRKKMAKKNLDTFFLKVKTTGMLAPVQGAAVSNYLSFFVPLLSNISGAIGVDKNAEFKLYQTLYDRVRINSVKVMLTPKANVFSQDAAQNDAALTLTGDGMLHSVIDRDGPPPGNIATLSRYPSYRKQSLMKKMTRMYSIKYPTGVWLDAQTPFTDSQSTLNGLGLPGGCYFYAENLVEDKLEIWNEPVYEFNIEYNVVFCGKTSAAIGYDPDTGVVTLTPHDLSVPLANTITTVSGTISDKVQTTNNDNTIEDRNDQFNPSFSTFS